MEDNFPETMDIKEASYSQKWKFWKDENFKRLLPIKAHYLLIFGGSSAIYPYIYIYAKQLGMTADVVGYITSAMWCITVLSRPLLGGLADYFQKFKLVLICMLVTSIVTDLGLSFIPMPKQGNNSNSTINSTVICHQNNSYSIQYRTDACGTTLSDCTQNCLLSCSLCEANSINCIDDTSEEALIGCLEKFSISCADDTTKNKCKTGVTENSTDSDYSVVKNPPLQIALFSTFATIFFICQTTVESLSDAACGKALEDKMELYGRQRMWGTIGWGLFSLLAGSLNHAFSESDSVINYMPGFYTSVVFYTLDVFMISKLQLKHSRSTTNVFKDVGWLLLRPRILFFILQVAGIGMIRGIFTTYLLWYLENLGASALLLGSITSVQSFLGEVPFLFISGWIIRKIGHLNVFTMSFIAHGLRFLAYAFIENPLWGLLIEFLQGPSYGSFYAALTTYVKLVAPKGAEATVQGISLAALEGLGTAAGSLLGGYWMHQDGRQAFFQAGILSIVFGMATCIMNGLIMCKLVK
ncbi:maltose permease-like [Argiope bruennichi]|nr:maltose permease-like [Argiope bruennichi]XP_055937437.1 maltose permease-like [Argiope bruennichi]XP_055937438.1 maltose permease-like [Argiope bruennichi]XP_055937439.1 maltose permease-like [Argiope bruennichi]